MVPYSWLGGKVASDKEVAMVTWTQLLTFVLVIIAVIDLTVRARK